MDYCIRSMWICWIIYLLFFLAACGFKYYLWLKNKIYKKVISLRSGFLWKAKYRRTTFLIRRKFCRNIRCYRREIFLTLFFYHYTYKWIRNFYLHWTCICYHMFCIYTFSNASHDNLWIYYEKCSTPKNRSNLKTWWYCRRNIVCRKTYCLICLRKKRS